MAEPRSRRTGEHNQEIIKLLADAVTMRQRLDALENRVLKLEAELTAARKASVRPPTSGAAPPRPASKRPPGPPPLPPLDGAGGMSPRMPPIPKSSGRRSVVDISEIAELVDSVPPPGPRSK